jgi:hypothetical protein
MAAPRTSGTIGGTDTLPLALSRSAEQSSEWSADAEVSAANGGRSTSSNSSPAAGSGAARPAVQFGAALWKRFAKNERARRLHAVARQLELRRELERLRNG